MEHLPGAPLDVPPGGLPIDLAIDYGIQAAAAIAAAHDAGIVHRDIKPANMMVGPDSHIKVLDFGIAKRAVVSEDHQSRQITLEGPITAPGVIVGTPGYLAPEQIAGQGATLRSDVFSFGAVLFEMLTGTRAFTGASTWATLDATVRIDPPSVTSVRPEAPVSLARIVSRCLAKNPEDRYPSARELRDDLVTLRTERAALSSGGSSRYARAALAIAVVLTLLAGGALIWSRARESNLRWARDTAVPEIARLSNAGEMVASAEPDGEPTPAATSSSGRPAREGGCERPSALRPRCS